jgi:hypothetical protein
MPELTGNGYLFRLFPAVPGVLVGGNQTSLTGETRMKIVAPAGGEHHHQQRNTQGSRHHKSSN